MGGSETDDLLLLKFGDRLFGVQGTAAVFDDVLDVVLTASGADGAILRLAGDSGAFRRRRAYDRDPGGQGIEDPCAAVLAFVDAADGLPLLACLGDALAVDASLRDELARHGVRTVQAVALTAPSGESLGILAVFWQRPHRPAEAGASRFYGVARQVALVVERMLTVALCGEGGSRGISVIRPVLDVLARMVERGVLQLMRPDGIAFLLHDGAQYHYADGEPVDVGEVSLTFRQLDALAGPVRRGGGAVLASDVANDGRLAAELRAGPVAACLLVPLGEPETIAVLAVYCDRPRVFETIELAVLEALAEVAGLALRHAGTAGALQEQLAQRQGAAAALREREARLRRALAAGEVYAWEWRCSDDALIVSETCAGILGAPYGQVPATGSAWMERIHADDREHYRELREALTRVSGRQSLTYRYLRPDGSAIWLQEECRAEYGSDGRLRRVTGLTRDVSARRRVEELQRLLMREFDHRARNMLATIQAMISLTARTQTNIDQFVAAVQSRIQSMARAHELIAGSRWTGASLRAIVSDELDPYVAGRPGAASIAGVDEVLTPGATMAVAMAVHELTTNAAKYGALSVAEGRIDIELHRDAGGRLLIEWRESDGPKVMAPAHRGFGSLLIEGSIRAEVGGTAEIRYLPAGLSCTITIPPAHVVAREEAESVDRVADPGGDPADADPEHSLLVVEDPSAARFDTPGRLRSFGYRVMVAHSVDEAVRLAGSEPLAAAIVDINIGERDVFPVVDVLTARELPIAFMTGYRLMSLPTQYRSFPVLSRPLRRETVHRMLSRAAGAPPPPPD